ncbi:transporter substrate-binding domain-containing protein [Corallincola platygyrae]|uniref:Transporter substrate-binding domain-containing protein n=1 Tax=Corallincola platygyrae TaxID=1193278 RepID=A0ABW4XKD2_9GAMM
MLLFSARAWLATLLYIVCFALTAEQKQREAHLVIGVQDFEDYQPYSYWLNGQYKGFNRELFDLFSDFINTRILYQAFSVKRRSMALVEGDASAVYPDNPNWAMATKAKHTIVYSQPVVSFVDGIFVQKTSHNLKVSELKRLGVPLGFTPTPYLSSIELGVIKTHYDANLGVLLKMLDEGALDGVYINKAVAEHWLANNPDIAQRLTFANQLPYIEDSRYLSSRDNGELIDLFNHFLKTRAAAIDALKSKYGLK